MFSDFKEAPSYSLQNIYHINEYLLEEYPRSLFKHIVFSVISFGTSDIVQSIVLPEEVCEDV